MNFQFNHMDHPQRSFQTTFSSASDNPMVLPTTHEHLSPIRAPSEYPKHPQPVTGLGISYGEIENPLGQMNFYPFPQRLNLPTTEPADWREQLLPSGPLFDASLDMGQLTPQTSYAPLSATNASSSPMTYCSPQALSASSSRGSIMDMNGSQSTAYDDALRVLPNTPCSDATTLSENYVRVKEEPEDGLDNAFLPEASCPAEGSAFMKAQHENPHRSLPNHHRFIGQHGKLINVDETKEVAVDRSRDETNAVPIEVPNADGCTCTVCGYRFTRRSNCQEHMKKHDPSRRKSYACEICSKCFGRNTDLKRHFNSIHLGIKKFGCEGCGERFARLDTLRRHQSDGCNGVPRKPRGPKKEKGVSGKSQSPPFVQDLY